MGNLETMQRIGETSTKVFDEMNNDEKKEGFKSLIEDLDENSSINRIKNKRNSMTESQKLKLYKRNAVTISEGLKNGNVIYKYYRTLANGAVNTAKSGGKNAIKFAFLEQIPCRFFVELGIFEKPKGLTEEKLIDDIKKDAKNFNIYLGFCETVCKCIPEATVAVPFIGMARHYSKWYKDHGTEAIISRLAEKKESEIRQRTSHDLAEALQDDIKKVA